MVSGCAQALFLGSQKLLCGSGGFFPDRAHCNAGLFCKGFAIIVLRHGAGGVFADEFYFDPHGPVGGLHFTHFAAGFVAVFAPLAVRAFRRRT